MKHNGSSMALRDLRESGRQLMGEAKEAAKRGVNKVRKSVQDRPFAVAAGALLIGVVIGALLRRK